MYIHIDTQFILLQQGFRVIGFGRLGGELDWRLDAES